ncbi:MAG: NAD-dependent deacylase [Flavobacteriales bacterium]|nr:NAD-dependent deacylase [Flavobacteriales bacterium]
MKKKIVVFTGAGVSADSGISTFRDADGLWDKYRIEDVCTPEALYRDRATVIEFYNKRRKEVFEKQPNTGHLAIAELEKYFDVQVVTQNIDNLHERAGSTHVTHLHGEVTKLRSTDNADVIFPLDGWKQDIDLRAPDGALARPHIVFFGEAVPMFDTAVKIVQSADIFVIVGTSLAVYPAASLLQYVNSGVPVYLVDPGEPDLRGAKNDIEVIKMRGAQGVHLLAEKLKKEYL